MDSLSPLPWEPHPDPDVFDGIELPNGVFVTFEPNRRCDCADCLEGREGADGGE